MKQGSKQRIVGTVVLLALALIFLPIVFDGEGSYQSPLSSRIPDAPLITIFPQPLQSRPVIVGDIETDEPTGSTTAAEANEVTTPPVAVLVEDEPVASVEITESQAVFSREIPQLTNSGLPEAWSVRLGSFSDADNANALMDKLQAADYKAYTRGITSGQDALTGVFVGPWLNRGQVNEYQRKLQQEFNLAGLVVRYELESL